MRTLLANKVWKFVRSRALRYQLLDNTELVLSAEPQGKVNLGITFDPQSQVNEGRRRIRRLAPLIAAVVAKVVVIGALLVKGVVLLVITALIVSKLALLVSGVLAAKNLFKKSVSYGLVQHPVHSESHVVHGADSPSGWGRALEGFIEGLTGSPMASVLGNDLAYHAHQP